MSIACEGVEIKSYPQFTHGKRKLLPSQAA